MAVDPELATALKQAKTKPMFFAFVAKGTDSKLLVGKKKISPKDAADAKKECGGGTIYKGRCRGDDGTLVFEVAKKVPETLSALTKKVIKQNAGMTLEVEYRIAADLEEEEGEGEGEEASEKPETQDELAARWKDNLTKWTPAIKKALDAKGPNAGAIAKLLAQATALSKPGADMVQALARLNECHELATETPTDDPAAEWERRVTEMEPKILEAQKSRGGDAKWMSMFMTAQDLGSNGDFAKSFVVLDKLDALLETPPQAPPLPPETTTGGADPAAEFKKNLAAWTPKIKEAMAAKGPNAPAIAKLLAQATSQAKPGGDMAEALKLLTECHELSGGQVVDEKQAEFTQRLKAITSDYDKIKDSDIAKDRNIPAAMTKIQDLASKGQYAQALGLLEAVEPAIRSAARAGGAAEEIRQAAGGNIVAFRTCRLEWDKARKQADQQVAAFVSAVLAEEELQNEPDFPEIQANLGKLKEQLAPFGEELYDLLDQAMVAKTEEEREKLNKACLAQIQKYQNLLAGATALEAMEDTSFGSFTIYSALSDAIDKMSGMLA